MGPACVHRSLVVDRQNGAVIGDEDGKEAGGLGRARILAHKMLAPGRLEKGFARAIDLEGPVAEFSERIAPVTTKAKTLPRMVVLRRFAAGA